MRRTIKTEAIVLRKRSLPNQDTIVTLFSKKIGKVNAFAKGIKKITSRRLPHVQTANLINAIFYKKDSRFYLRETNLISGFSQIKKNPHKIQLLYLFLFVVERLLPENQLEEAVYKLVLNFLIELSETESQGNSLLTKYLNEILKLLGYSKDDKSYEELVNAIEEIIHEKIPELHI